MKDSDTLPLTTSSVASSTATAKKETDTINLRWSAGNINHFSDDLVFQIYEDLDEIEEREKVVKHMWDVYNNGHRIRLPRFWQEAFEAAYEEFTSDSPDVVDFVVAEIARMSIRSVVIDPPPLHSTVRILWLSLLLTLSHCFLFVLFC
ncbi:unnamed protein product [Cochlearia groenlandica]